jgi:hypothetical protein
MPEHTKHNKASFETKIMPSSQPTPSTSSLKMMPSSRSITSTTSASDRPSLFKSKSRRSNSSRSVDTAPECPTTPPRVTFESSPSKKSSKDYDREMKVLTVMVQALALKLKKREKQVVQLKKKSQHIEEICLALESAEERLVDVVAENQALVRKVRCLQSTINLQDVEENNRWIQRDAQREQPPTTSADTAAASATAANTQRTNSEEYHQIILERDMALLRAGEMAISLAESQAETDELRDELGAITHMMQAQKGATDGASSDASVLSAPVSPTSVAMPEFPVRSLQGSLKDLTDLWGSGRTLTKSFSSAA